ncbi:MAG TPA: hypothetical protein VED46_07655 [Alphaproteobacteria bacterium]|nr:hypothetical protein [Alphaproteobacteria bacterium]
MLVLRAGGILLIFGAALPLVLSLVPSVERGYYKNLTAREFWRQLNGWSLRMVESLAGDPHSAFFGQIFADILQLPAWAALGVPGILLLFASFVRKE